MSIDAISDALQTGDRAIAIFTRKRNLHLQSDGTGWTGNWVLDSAREYRCVVIPHYSRLRRSGVNKTPVSCVQLVNEGQTDDKPGVM